MNAYEALAEIVADPAELTLGLLTPVAAAQRRCERCERPVDVRVSTGVRWVCLDCAVVLS